MTEKIPPIADFSACAFLSPESGQKVWDAVNTGWTPGKAGKGFVNAGRLYTWNVTNDDGWPHHDHVIDLLSAADVPVDEMIYYQIIVYIDADGEFDCENEELEPIIVRQEPRLTPTPENDWRFGSTRTADEGGGGDSGGDMGGGDSGGSSEAPSEAPAETHGDTNNHHDHHDHVHYLGAPWYGGVWGRSHAAFQEHHRVKKNKKKRKKKSNDDFWDQQRMEDFPEDFQDLDLADAPTINYTDEDIHNLVAKGHTRKGYRGMGKGILKPDGFKIYWDVDATGAPHHQQVEQALGVRSHDCLTVNEDGTEDSHNEQMAAINQGDWKFGAGPAHSLNWDEGEPGKGVLFPDGSLHTWNQDEYYTHGDYLSEKGLNGVVSSFLYIERSGSVHDMGDPVPGKHHAAITTADPRLHFPKEHGSDWQFA